MNIKEYFEIAPELRPPGILERLVWEFNQSCNPGENVHLQLLKHLWPESKELHENTH